MNLEKSTELNLEYKGIKRNYEFIINSDGKLFLFSSYFNPKSNEKTLYSQTINKKSMHVNNDVIKISVIENYRYFKVRLN